MTNETSNLTLTPTIVVRETRKFPRVQMPLQVNFNDIFYQSLDCSVNGIQTSGTPHKLAVGDTANLKIYAPTAEGKIRIDVKGQLIWTNKIGNRSGWLFINIRPEQQKLIAELTLLYASGQLQQTEGQLLKMTSETSKNELRKNSAEVALTPSLPKVRLIMGLIMFAVLGIVAALFLFKLIYAKMFLVEASSANIFSAVTSVASPVEGTLIEIQKSGAAKPNQVIAKISQPSGTSSDIISPCDCEIISASDRVGTYIGLGEVVAVLVRQDSKPSVAVRIPFNELERVVKGATVTLTYLDGRTVKAAKIVGYPKVGDEPSTIVSLFVEAGLELKPSQVGEPVYAEINVAPW